MKLTPLLLGLGTGEIILIVLAILLLFGAKRIPELMKSMGKGVKKVEKEINTPADETAAKEPSKDAEPESK